MQEPVVFTTLMAYSESLESEGFKAIDVDMAEDDEPADASEGPAEPDVSQYLQHYAPPAQRGSAPGMLSFDLTQAFLPVSFTQNMQESNPEDCEVEPWTGGRLKCLPEAQNFEEDSVDTTYLSQAGDDEAHDVKHDMIIHVPPEAKFEEIGSEEEIENLSKCLKILRS